MGEYDGVLTEIIRAERVLKGRPRLQQPQEADRKLQQARIKAADVIHQREAVRAMHHRLQGRKP